MLVVDGRQGLLEQRDERHLARSRPNPGEPSTVAQRGACKQIARLLGTRDLRRLQERLPAEPDVTRCLLGLA